jgi:hypothetical protein
MGAAVDTLLIRLSFCACAKRGCMCACRFIVVADRIASSKTVDDIKDRYYSISRKLLELNATPEEVLRSLLPCLPRNICFFRILRSILFISFPSIKNMKWNERHNTRSCIIEQRKKLKKKNDL